MNIEMSGVIQCPPSKRIKAAGGIGQHVKGSGSMPDRLCLVEHKKEFLSKNAKRKAARYRERAGDGERKRTRTVGHYLGTKQARKACRARYKERLLKDFAILLK